jgi:DNA-binding transcriptional LysR family regulator
VNNTYPAVVQQALAGRGVALGWRGVIDQYVDDGLLVTVGPEVCTDCSYYLAWPTGRRTPAVDAVISWMTPAQ